MWTKENIPDQTGKTAMVTGANTGIGYETALALYEKGAHVIVAGRDTGKIQQAIDNMKALGGKGSLEAGIVDLGSLKAIQAFAETFKSQHQRLDILINNAGIMVPPPQLTEDGFESQFGINFIGHFALTGRLLPLLQNSNAARVVTLYSGAATYHNEIDFDNLRLEKDYDANRAYGISKLADFQFALALDRRMKAMGAPLISTAAHPGVVYSDLSRHFTEDQLQAAFQRFSVIMQPWQGALPALFAATAEGVTGGSYYGPDGERELTGYPAPSTRTTDAMLDEQQGNKLWAYAENAVGHLFASPVGEKSSHALPQ